MSDNLEKIRDDISYLRELAGDDGMVLRASGIGLMVAGVIFPLIGLRMLLIENGLLDWPASLRPLMPFDGVLLFFVTLFACFALDGKGKAPAPLKMNAASRAMWAGWAAVGMGYLVTAIACSLAGNPKMAVVSLFAFWGGGWVIVWAIYKHAWLLILTFCCYALTLLGGLYWGTKIATMLFIAGWFAMVGLPGVFIYRYARSLQ